MNRMMNGLAALQQSPIDVAATRDGARPVGYSIEVPGTALDLGGEVIAAWVNRFRAEAGLEPLPPDRELDEELNDQFSRAWVAHELPWFPLGGDRIGIPAVLLDDVDESHPLWEGFTDWQILEIYRVAEANSENIAAVLAHRGITAEEVAAARGTRVHSMDDRSRLLFLLKSGTLTERDLVARTRWSRARVQRRLRVLVETGEVARVLGGGGKSGRATAFVLVEAVPS